MQMARKGNVQFGGYDGVLRGDTESPVGLGRVDPHALPDTADVDTVADSVDNAGGVAVRDHPRVEHRRAGPAAPLLGVARVDSGDGDTDAHITGAGDQIGQLAHVQHLGGGALLVVPGRKHMQLRWVGSRVLRAWGDRSAGRGAGSEVVLANDFAEQGALGAADGAGLVEVLASESPDGSWRGSESGRVSCDRGDGVGIDQAVASAELVGGHPHEDEPAAVPALVEAGVVAARGRSVVGLGDQVAVGVGGVVAEVPQRSAADDLVIGEDHGVALVVGIGGGLRRARRCCRVGHGVLVGPHWARCWSSSP